MERLDKTVSASLGISRAEARKAVLKGEITVGGQTVRDIGFKVDPESDEIFKNNKPLVFKKYIYYIMNKPKGVLSACEDRRQTTVIDLLPQQSRRRNMFPVGRLDKNTTGLLIITDDGNFAHKLLSPSKKVYKEYLAELDDNVCEKVCGEFEKGVVLADGTKLLPAKIILTDKQNEVRVRICEGKYHQIKRMFGVFGLGVNNLKRIEFAGLRLPENISEGSFRELTQQEYDILAK